MAAFENDTLTEKIIGCCFEVHKHLGPGFLEKVYSKALQHQLELEDYRSYWKKSSYFTSRISVLEPSNATSL